MSPESAPTSRVRRTGDVVSVDGALDGSTGALLTAAVTEAVAFGCRRLEIDLCAIDAFDSDGATALLTCRNITADLPDGLHYRTRPGGAGQEALLLAYADPHATDGSAASSEAWEPAS